MKKLLLISLLLWGAALQNAQSQAFYPLRVNNINAVIPVHGDMWWGGYEHYCYFPADSTTNISGPGAVWLSAYDGASNLYVSAQLSGETYNDFSPGILGSRDTVTNDTSSLWARVWAVSQSDINFFITHPILDTTDFSAAYDPVVNWPGKGNRHCMGSDAITSVTLNYDMAPFVDLNGDGIYEPMLHEYPAIKGDLAVWWSFCDNGPTHNQTNGKPLGVEVHAMAYAYKRGTLIDNVVYYEYTIVNRSSNNYHNFRMGIWDEPVIGFDSVNNFIGFDSVRRMAITYKATPTDPGGFGANMPISAITMIVLPGDTLTSYVPAGSFTYYVNDTSAIGRPNVDTEYNNYMRAKLRNGMHFKDDFLGPGAPAYGDGSGPDCNYVFPGDPSNTTQWSECASSNTPQNIHYILSSNDFDLSAGESKKIVFAIITTNPGPGNGCPSETFSNIETVADTAWYNYFNPPPAEPAGIAGVKNNKNLKIYPNPAHDKLFVVNTGNTGSETIIVYNTLGQALDLPVSKNGQKDEVDVSKLPEGLYYVLYRNGDNQITTKFLKE